MLLSEQVRLRIRDEMRARQLSQRDVAGLTGWSQSKVAHQLTAHTEMKVDDLAALCFAVGLSVPEVVRDPAREWCAELTPTELRVVERYRTLPEAVQKATLVFLAVPPIREAGRRHTAHHKARKAPLRGVEKKETIR